MGIDLGSSLVSLLMVGTMLDCHGGMREPKVERNAVVNGTQTAESLHTKGQLAAQVTWEIESVPPSASVIDRTSNQALGQTPWRSEQPASQQTRTVRIQKSGYEPLDLDLSLDRSEKRTLVLRLQIL